MITTNTPVIRGTVAHILYASATRTMGRLTADGGRVVKFKAPFLVTLGEYVSVTGSFVNDPTYGAEFVVTSMAYDLPEDPKGLEAYLARCPAFVGVGPIVARKIVRYASSGAGLDRLIRHDFEGLCSELDIPRATMETLRETWVAHGEENAARCYLAGLDLSNRQMDALLDRFGLDIVGILRQNPYKLLGLVEGFAFKTIDTIARKTGIGEYHEGRIEAGVLYAIGEAVSGDGHTWLDHGDLLRHAGSTLLLTGPQARGAVESAVLRLVGRGDLVREGAAVSPRRLYEAEATVREALERYAHEERPVITASLDVSDMTEGQVDAYRKALRHPVCVVSGGAGTGKTFLIARLTRTFRAARMEVALCAPTGKAAKRIEEMMADAGIGVEAKTIHRLLAHDGQSFQRPSLSEVYRVPQYGKFGEQLEDDVEPAYDVVVVDEASMVDAPLMAAVISRIDFNRTRLLLVGDHNQLPPVGPGNVLRDIIRHDLAPITLLTEVKRQTGVLRENCAAILSQQWPASSPDRTWVVLDSTPAGEKMEDLVAELVTQAIPREFGLDPVTQVQVVTPQHKGELGTQGLNRRIQMLLRGHVSDKDRFAPGDRIIQTTNDYGLGVMNGTMGYFVRWQPKGPEGPSCLVRFDDVVVTLRNEQVHNITLAYAVTAHKAQGSEFPCVVVVCNHSFADRAWLYTACTRARDRLFVVGGAAMLRQTIARNRTNDRRTLLDLWTVGPDAAAGAPSATSVAAALTQRWRARAAGAAG